MKDNWFMGYKPVSINTIGELLNEIEGFNTSFKLIDENGNPLTIQISKEKGYLIITGKDNDIPDIYDEHNGVEGK